MARKRPNPPVPLAPENNTPKALDRWNNEGGAPKGGQYHRKRSTDANQRAKAIIDSANERVAA